MKHVELIEIVIKIIIVVSSQLFILSHIKILLLKIYGKGGHQRHNIHTIFPHVDQWFKSWKYITQAYKHACTYAHIP